MTRTILVVDDDADIRLLVQTVLSQAGFEVLQSATGKGGLDIASTGSVDLVLLDLHIPDLDAWTFLIRSWEHPTAKQVPVVMFTASGDESVADRARAWGCRGFLAKPFTAEDLLAVIDQALVPAAG